MRHFLRVILYLYIYTLFCDGLNAQQLTLLFSSEKEVATSLLDSINWQANHPDLKSIRSQTDTTLFQLRRLGFIESRLDSIHKKNDTVFISHFNLGNQWRAIRIKVNPSEFSKSELRQVADVVSDTVFELPLNAVEPALKFLNQLKASEGDAFVRLRLTNIRQLDQTFLTATLELSGQPPRSIDQIVVKGYDKFPQSFLKYYAGIRKDRPFVQKEIVRKTELLNNLGFVRTIKPPEALFRRDTTEVYVYLEKRNNNLFDGILGFATDEDSGSLTFNGFLNLELNNNLNFGEQLLIRFKADGREQQNFQVTTKLPYLFKTPLGLGAELKIFKRDSTFSTTDQQIRLSYQVHPTTSIYGGYKSYESSILLDEVIAGTPISDYDSNFVLLGGAYGKPQNSIFFPNKTYLGLDVELGNRALPERTENQFRIMGQFYHIFNLNARNSIYINNNTSVLSSESYLTNELFRFGGINSLRGFDENSIDASLFSVLNTEYRYLVGRTLYLHSIVDLGYFENQTLDLKEELYSVGFGIGLQTEAGVFRLNLANGVSGQQNFKFSNTKIHLSLSSRF